MKKSTKMLTRAGIISALYVILVFPTITVASGFVQFRPSEALTILPIFLPESIPALAVGCFISNLITGCNMLDVVFGSLITLFAGVLTRVCTLKIKNFSLKVLVGGLFPVLMNAFLLPVVWYFVYGKMELMYILNVLSLFISQSISVYILGGFLSRFIKSSTLLE